MSKISDFYQRLDSDSENRYIDEILAKDDEWWETCHSFIQWVFPLNESSEFNSNAPILTQNDIYFFHSREAWHYSIRSCRRFLEFLGIGLNDNGYFLADNFEYRKHTWAEGFNHNHLRISRFLKFLCLTGCKYTLAVPLVKFMSERMTNEYWEEAIKTPALGE